MIKIVKTELYKSIHNKFFVFAVLLAFCTQLFSFFSNLDYVKIALEHAYGNFKLVSPNWRGSNDQMNMYVMWLSEEGYSMGFTLAQYMLPILAVLPYGWSLFSEVNKGYQNNMLCRVGKFRYFTAKYIATFISGAIVIAFMLIVNLMLCALIGEHGAPLCYTQTTSVRYGHIASEIYYSKPFLAALIWTLISALWAGALAGLTSLAGQFLKRSIFVLSLPLFVTILWDNICLIILRASSFSFIRNFFLCTSTRDNWIIWLEIFGLIAIGLGGGLICYTNREAL